MIDYIEDEEDFDLKILDGISSRDMVDFLDGPIWSAVYKDVARRLLYTDVLLESAPLEDVYGPNKDGDVILQELGIRKLQGACLEMRYLLALPQEFKNRITEREEDVRSSKSSG